MDNDTVTIKLENILYTTQLPKAKIIRRIGNSSFVLIPSYVLRNTDIIVKSNLELIKVTMFTDKKDGKEKLIIVIEAAKNEF